MKIVDAVTNVVKQGGKRRGANMGIMDASHPDIDKFIAAKTEPGVLENFNVSMGIDKEFWDAVLSNGFYELKNPRNGQVTGVRYGRHMMEWIAKAAYKSAEPGLIFFDNINRHNPLMAQKGPLTATNPCFHPDTVIETVKGPMKIKDMKEDTRVYTCSKDGKLTTRMASKSWVSRKNTETLKLTLNNGREFIITPDHKLLSKDLTWLEARDVHVGTHLVGLCRTRRGARYVGIRLSSEDPRAYRMEHRFVYEQTSQESIPKSIDVHHIDGNTHNNCVTNLMKIPHYEHARLTAYTQPNNHQVRNELGNFIESGRHGAKVIINVPEQLGSRFPNTPRITKIEEGPITDVYDLTVEDTHCVIANGIVAHNCGEQALYPYESCNLGSINLANFVKDGQFDYEHYNTVIRLATRFLDNVIDVNKYPLERINTETKKTRRIGLGIMGLADALFKLNMAYNSEDGYEMTDRLAERLSFTSMQESARLAKERGSYPLYNKDEFLNNFPVAGAEGDDYWKYLKDVIAQYGIRNAWTTTIAPTGTLSMIAHCSNGVEPMFACPTRSM